MKMFSDSKIDDINNWYDNCVKEQKPYIVVSSRKKYADVNFDYISFSKENEERLRINEDKIIADLSVIYNKYCCEKTNAYFSPLTVSFKNVSLSDAKLVAEDVFEVFYSYTK